GLEANALNHEAIRMIDRRFGVEFEDFALDQFPNRTQDLLLSRKRMYDDVVFFQNGRFFRVVTHPVRKVVGLQEKASAVFRSTGCLVQFETLESAKEF